MNTAIESQNEVIYSDILAPAERESILRISQDSENGHAWVLWNPEYGVTIGDISEQAQKYSTQIIQIGIVGTDITQIVARVVFRVMSHVDLGNGFENKPGHHLMVQAQVFS